MAEVQIYRQEMEIGLPSVCLCCGAPAASWQEKVYEIPGNELTGGLGFISRMLRFGEVVIGAPTQVFLQLGQSWFRKQVTLKAPFCDTHQGHWPWRRRVIVGGLAASLFVLIGGILGSVMGGWDLATGFVVGMGIFVCWCILAVIAHETSIHCTAIDENGITLKGVSERFAVSLNDYRR